MSSIRNLSGQGWSPWRSDAPDHRNGGKSPKSPEIRTQEPVVKAVKGNPLHIMCAHKLRVIFYATYRGFALTILTTTVRVWKLTILAVEVVQ